MIPTLSEIGVMIRHHHERYDGQGFPDQLKGEDIPFGARLICAADMFERQLIQLPESDALPAALKALEGEWGKSLDPKLRIALNRGAKDVYRNLNVSIEILEAKVSPAGLEVGMQLKNDLHTGTGVLLLKRGTILDENKINAMQRSFMIDPFERDIVVLIKRTDSD